MYMYLIRPNYILVTNRPTDIAERMSPLELRLSTTSHSTTSRSSWQDLCEGRLLIFPYSGLRFSLVTL